MIFVFVLILGIIVGFSCDLMALTNADSRMISENQEYLSDRENFYRNKVSNIYLDWIISSDLLHYEKNRLLLSSTDNFLSLESNVQKAFSELEGLKYGNIDKYYLKDILIPLLKLSQIDKKTQIFVQYLNEIDEKISQHNLPSKVQDKWKELFIDAENNWNEYHKSAKDPFLDKHLSLKGFGEYLIDSTKQLKSSARMGWNVSERTFLRPVKYAKQLQLLKDIKDIPAKLKTYYNITMIGYKYLIKEKEDDIDLSDSEKTEQIRAYIKDIKEVLKAPPYNGKGTKVLSLIQLIDTGINISRWQQNITFLEEKYKDNEYMYPALNKTKLYLTGQLLQTVANTIVTFAKLTTIDKIDGLGDIIVIGNDLIQTFNANVSGYRRSMERHSLAKEYLIVLLDSLEILEKFYMDFMKEINPYAKFHIENSKRMNHYAAKQKILECWIADFEAESKERIDYYVSTGRFFKSMLIINMFKHWDTSVAKEVQEYANENVEKNITLDKAIWMLDKFSLKNFENLDKDDKKYKILYYKTNIHPRGSEDDRDRNRLLFLKLNANNIPQYVKRQFITMQGRQIAEDKYDLENLKNQYVSGYKAIDLLLNYQTTLSYYYGL